MTPDRRRQRRTAAVAAVTLATLGALAAGCTDDEPEAATPTPTDKIGDMGDMDMAGMLHDPSATPADELPDAVAAEFQLLDTRPPGTDTVAGTAWLAQGGEVGTTLTVTMTGLEPGTDYVGHLHADECAADNGGPHFAFDPAGPATPPNEVHIGFTADDSGAGTATVTNEREVGDAARAVVVHPADAMDNRLVCADF